MGTCRTRLGINVILTRRDGRGEWIRRGATTINEIGAKNVGIGD